MLRTQKLAHKLCALHIALSLIKDGTTEWTSGKRTM